MNRHPTYWKAYHTFEETKMKIDYNSGGFFSTEMENGDGKSKLAITLVRTRRLRSRWRLMHCRAPGF